MIMRNLKVWQKLAVMGAVFMLPFAAMTYKMVSSVDTLGIEFARQEIRGLEYYRPLSRLLQDLQQHRDMSAAVLSGDASFKESLDRKAGDIETDIKNVDEIDRQLNSALQRRHEMGGLERLDPRTSGEESRPACRSELCPAHESDCRHDCVDQRRGRFVQPHPGSRPRQLLPDERSSLPGARIERDAGTGARSRRRHCRRQAGHDRTIRHVGPPVASSSDSCSRRSMTRSARQ